MMLYTKYESSGPCTAEPRNTEASNKRITNIHVYLPKICWVVKNMLNVKVIPMLSESEHVNMMSKKFYLFIKKYGL